MELVTGVPVEYIFSPEGSQDPEVKEVIEWFLSDSQGGKDRSGATVEYDSNNDILLPPADFRERVEKWKASGEPNSYPLNIFPDEMTFRALLEGEGFYYRGMGMIVRSQKDWLEILRAGDPPSNHLNSLH